MTSEIAPTVSTAVLREALKDDQRWGQCTVWVYCDAVSIPGANACQAHADILDLSCALEWATGRIDDIRRILNIAERSAP